MDPQQQFVPSPVPSPLLPSPVTKPVLLIVITAAVFLGVVAGAATFYFLPQPGVVSNNQSDAVQPTSTGCDDLTGENRDRCLVVLAAHTDQPLLCERLTERKKNHDFCSKLLNTSAFSQCKSLPDFYKMNECVFQKVQNDKTIIALPQGSSTSNQDPCAGLQGADTCYATLAPRLKDYSICERVVHKTDSSNYENCLMNTAIALGDKTGCMNLGTFYQPSAGLDAADFKDLPPEFLAEFEESKNFMKFSCLMGVAVSKKDVKICDLLPMTPIDKTMSRGFCVSQVQYCLSDKGRTECAFSF